MKDVNSLYPKEMRELLSDPNKYDVDKLFELRKHLGNHWSFNLWWGVLHEDDKDDI